MKISEIVREVCRREGLKKQAEVAQIREIIAHLSDMSAEQDSEVAVALYKNGARRAKRRKK